MSSEHGRWHRVLPGEVQQSRGSSDEFRNLVAAVFELNPLHAAPHRNMFAVPADLTVETLRELKF